MPRVQINDFEMHYREAGDGPAVVYVHGGFSSLGRTLQDPEDYEWRWEWEFARHFRFIRYDRRGCEKSSLPDGGFDLSNQAIDLAMLLDHLGIERVHVLGSSAGGPISIVFGCEHPQRVHSIILQGTGLDVLGDNPVTTLIREQIDILDNDGAEAAFDRRPRGVEVWFESIWRRYEAEVQQTIDGFLEEEEKLASRAAALSKSERIRWYAAELKSMQAYLDVDLAPCASRIAAPVLVLHGSNDPVVPVSSADELAAIIPNSRLHVVEGGNHPLLHDNEEARRGAIEFIESADGPAGAGRWIR